MIVLCFLIGFVAQIIDGTLGMAYGVSCNTFLQLFFHMTPLMSSSLVHFSEILTSGVSALSYYKMKNIDKQLFVRLLLPGIAGGVIGALLLSDLGSYMEIPVAVYLVIMGLVLVVKAIRNRPAKPRKMIGGFIYPVAALGGLLDAAGGGGWGPVVNTTMLSRSENVSQTIGSVNTAEFFVTLAESIVFSLTISSVTDHLVELVFLILGGVCAAPIAAWLCKKANKRLLLLLVGILVTGLNLFKLYSKIAPLFSR
jgi:uncharacterized membrane protein YfcA